MTPKHRMK